MKPVTKKLPGWVHIPLIVFMSISLVQTALGFTDLLEQPFLGHFQLQLRC